MTPRVEIAIREAWIAGLRDAPAYLLSGVVLARFAKEDAKAAASIKAKKDIDRVERERAREERSRLNREATERRNRQIIETRNRIRPYVGLIGPSAISRLLDISKHTVTNHIRAIRKETQ